MIHVNFLHRALDLLTKSDRNKDCIYLQDDIPETMEALPGMSFQCTARDIRCVFIEITGS